MLRLTALLALLWAAVGCDGNRPPSAPDLSGPASSRPHDTLVFTVAADDPDGDEVAYKFSWGDTSSVAWSAEYLSGQTVTRQHSYADTGSYVIRVRARDAHGLEAGDYDSLVIHVWLAPPGTPGRPEGPAYCTTGVRYSYTVSASHPQSESLWFQFDWNGAVGSWQGPVAAESSFVVEHQFDTAGSYGVRARAKDYGEQISDWSEALVVTAVDIPGGPPQNCSLAAATDTTVRVSWSPPVEGTPSCYRVYFNALGGGGPEMVAETLGLDVEHNPAGRTGSYSVAAVFGATVYTDTLPLTTVPVHTGTITVGELSGPDAPGCGWSRSLGIAFGYPMADTAFCDSVDFYCTDFKPGSAGPVYCVASPDTAPSDSGGSVPAGRWRNTPLAPLADEQGPVPAAGDSAYQPVLALGAVPVSFGLLTVDGYYCAVKVTQIRIANEDIRVQAWFQAVRGLRLVRH